MFDFSNKEMVMNKLEELKSRKIPHMTYEKLCELYGDLRATENEIKDINEYFQDFCVAGYNDNKDIFSDEECHFQWDLAHGEMHTNDNGRGRRYYHYITVNGKKERFEILLQYHPDVYKIK